MVKCKLAITSKCDNCCCFCENKETCEDVCGKMINPCDEMFEGESELQIIQNAVPDVLKAIVDISVQKKKLDDQEKLMKQKLLEAMEAHNVKSFETTEVKFTYVSPTTRTSLDSTKLKKDHPDLVKEYQKISKVSASVRIQVK